VSPDDVPWTLAFDDYDLDDVRDRASRVTVDVIIPARDESSTIGGVLDAVLKSPITPATVWVVNDHSVDDTATVAAHHGATVISHQGEPGKGGAMATGAAASTADFLVFLDADVVNTTPDYLGRLLQPLLLRPEIMLSKGYYRRPLHDMPTGGGRVNELAARPILSLLYPGLGEIRQPLAGETALRRRVLDDVTFAPAYSVELALLVDVAQHWGIHSVAQVDLGTRRHRNRPLEELRPMAVDILRVALERRGLLPSR
jgi:glucosyl-3-phosphoglycerate synthase